MSSIKMPSSQRPAITTDAPFETPTYGPGGTWSIYCSTTIDASLQTVLTTVLDTRNYHSWNAFCPHVDVDSQPAPKPVLPAVLADIPIADLSSTLGAGTALKLHARLDPADASKRSKTALVVSKFEQFERDGRTGIRLVWRTTDRLMGLVLRAERVQDFIDNGQGGVAYECYETFYGILASTVRAVAGKALIWGFGAWMDGLKDFSERKNEA
ncbi:hypothetical protein S7711_10378 [Stachybotrys chartarum IBT 7711]|uniref:Coenzyme Q-binding protein COQ10 START domain-containing protein n=1 Tax=Stachybotrys chartarum (strain CBS 109288 / IBT 7711) TaxID=1280523 RepID=A0A084ATY5_STACB|nr:hypothetical protein S7711_10378 [Stachybotrys chartarum IBT 7711]KFA48677.1 hypothetical protein S40293_10833 [Stachybotrys chartarum IBT 40293]KFA73812.1 hypothetical protein S40288_10775 [Stachybotrys chartarum IBT 40288]